jgi:uncharacterized protein (TIGR02599 family)
MRPFTRLPNRARRPAFTLLEVVVTLAVLLMIFLAVMDFMTGIDQSWKSAAADPFAEAQNALETMSQNLASATLEPYQDYANAGGNFNTNTASAFVPDHLARRSDLDFACGPGSGANGLLAASGRATSGSAVFFLAPNGYTQTYAHTGVARLLNAMGYLVEFGDDNTAPAFTLTHTWRWRLKQVLQPAESLQIYANPASSAWIQQLVPTGAALPVLAENVITLIVLPERAASDTGPALSPAYSYDSRDTTNPLTLHQVPPRLRLALAVIDPTTAQRLAAQNGSNPPRLVPATLFQQSSQLDADLAALDASLTAQGINHRIFQRVIELPSSAWSNTNTPSP